MAEVKVPGAEWKAFLEDTAVWDVDGGSYVEDEEVIIGGKLHGDEALNPSFIKDDDQVVVRGGSIMKNSSDGSDSKSLLDVLKAWRKKRNTVYLVVEVSLEKEAGVKSAISGAGGKLRR